MLLYVLAAVAAVPVLWVLGDLTHYLAMKLWHARWEGRLRRDADGVREGAREFTVGAGETALLLVHGFGDSPAIFAKMAPALADRGFTCQTLRLPGHALPMAHYLKTNATQWREAVQGALADLRKKHPRVVVVAHSLGGAVALDALAERPDLADGLVLFAPLIAVCGRRSPLLSPAAWFYLLDALLPFTDRILTLFPQDLRDKEALPLMRTDGFVPRVVFRELFALLRRNRDRAKTFRTPLLMVLAPDDLVIDSRAAERFFHDCASAPKRLLHNPEAGHVLMLDFGWEKLVDETARFVREELGAPKKV
jgi:esterase/lipase